MFDAIVVGARCAGSPIAMLLARRGYRVLLVDRTTFPSDTISVIMYLATGADNQCRLCVKGKRQVSCWEKTPCASIAFY